jgi:hypothetical protein
METDGDQKTLAAFIRGMPIDIQRSIFDFTHSRTFVSIWRAFINSKEEESQHVALRMRDEFRFAGESIIAFIRFHDAKANRARQHAWFGSSNYQEFQNMYRQEAWEEVPGFDAEAASQSRKSREPADSNDEEFLRMCGILDLKEWEPWFEDIDFGPDYSEEVKQRELDLSKQLREEMEPNSDFEMKSDVEEESAPYMVQSFLRKLLVAHHEIDEVDVRIGHYIYEKLHAELPSSIGPILDTEMGLHGSDFGFNYFRLAMGALEVFDIRARRIDRIMGDLNVSADAPKTIEEAMKVLQFLEYARDQGTGAYMKMKLNMDDKIFDDMMKRGTDLYKNEETPGRIVNLKKQLNRLQKSQSQGFEYWKALVNQIERSQMSSEVNFQLLDSLERYDVPLVQEAISFAANTLKWFPDYIADGQAILIERLIPIIQAHFVDNDNQYESDEEEDYDEGLVETAQWAVGNLANLLGLRAPEARRMVFMDLYHSLMDSKYLTDWKDVSKWQCVVVYGLSVGGLHWLDSKNEQGEAEQMLAKVAWDLRYYADNYLQNNIQIRLREMDNGFLDCGVNGLFDWKSENEEFNHAINEKFNDFDEDPDIGMVLSERGGYDVAANAFWEMMAAARKTVSQRANSKKEGIAADKLIQYQGNRREPGQTVASAISL